MADKYLASKVNYFEGQFLLSKKIDGFQIGDELKEFYAKNKISHAEFESESWKEHLRLVDDDNLTEFAEFFFKHGVKQRKRGKGMGVSKTLEIIQKSAPELYSAIQEFDKALKDQDPDLYLSVVIRKKLIVKSKAKDNADNNTDASTETETAQIPEPETEPESEAVFDED